MLAVSQVGYVAPTALLYLPSAYRGGDMLLYLCLLSAVCESVSVSVIHFSPALSIVQAVKH